MYSAMDNDQPPERSAAEINLEKMIGDRLKQYYAAGLSRPLPDKFADLLSSTLAKIDRVHWLRWMRNIGSFSTIS